MDAAVLPGTDVVSRPSAPVATETVRDIVAGVVDPEIPVLTIEDLGILRSVNIDGGRVVVSITPTYSGCPAMRQIEDDVVRALREKGYDDVRVRMVHFPAWSSDWISESGRRKLAEFGIAPPTAEDDILCPRCRSSGPEMIARFGSTACKALMVCSSCGEPFDFFKEF